MAVRNVTNISLQEIINEINPTNRSLVGCFTSAKSKGFVSSYKGSSDRLSNFRGYSHGSGGYY